MIKKIFSKIIYLPFLLPIIYRIKFPFKNFGSINLLDLFLSVSIILGFILIIQEKKLKKFQKYLNQSKLIPGVGIFLLFGIISILTNFNHNWTRELGLLKSFFVLPILFTVIIRFFFQKTRFQLWSFLGCYFVYSVFLSFLTIIFWIVKQTTFDNRIQLFFDSPNQLAIALSLGIISGVLLRTHKAFKINLFLLLFLGLALSFTQSTGAILTVLIVVASIYLKKHLPKPNIIIKYILSLSLVFVLFLFFLTPFLNKINYNPFLNQNSSDSRLAIYLSTQKIISHNFINGIGLSNFQEKYLDNQIFFPPYPQWAVPHSHNLLTQIWLSFGFLGLITWVYLIYKKTLPVKNILREVSFYFLLYFLIHGLIDVPIWNNDQALFFWFIFLF